MLAIQQCHLTVQVLLELELVSDVVETNSYLGFGR